ncbi:MAG: hypothetical protein AAF607_12505 [Pseudomonadota bacterium]
MLDKLRAKLTDLQNDTNDILETLKGSFTNGAVKKRSLLSILSLIGSRWEGFGPIDRSAAGVGFGAKLEVPGEREDITSLNIPQGALTELLASKAVLNENKPFLILFPREKHETGKKLIAAISDFRKAAPGAEREQIIEFITANGTDGILENILDKESRYDIEIPEAYFTPLPAQAKLLLEIEKDKSVLNSVEMGLVEFTNPVDVLVSDLRRMDLVGTGTQSALPPGAQIKPAFAQSVDDASNRLNNLKDIGVAVNSVTKNVEHAVKQLEGVVGAERLVGPILKPYAYVVLTIAAMLITVGLSLILKWARGADDDLDDTRHLWETATVTDMVATLHAAGIDAGSFSKLAASIRKNSDTPPEGLLPSPLMKTAQEGIEIVRAVKSK